jgi:hypothetical protein
LDCTRNGTAIAVPASSEPPPHAAHAAHTKSGNHSGTARDVTRVS